jgi:hypothetical protein
MVRPIPKKLLPHTVTHKQGVTLDRWQKETFAYSREIKNVRVEPSSERKRSKDNTEVIQRAVLFYDAVNSSPVGLSFNEGDLIIFNSHDYHVLAVEWLLEEGRLHHYEVGLI